ncbi:hypothetical protein PBNK65E_000491400 [Plasmodium berghei]|uniref:Fam-a protein n=1 Tax=Plasmodium berghei TaxID=5821 RepID=A0A113PEL7_PLABE|nr:hypothetical protein PBK173_000531500 [Plasmodium berghei]SBW38090.1 hypothetical protein PBNK65E_000491400 [Plasmodium berghei]SCL81316.1 hypothetical protein PBNK65NY_000487900 [Plasmodium berghei]
MNKFYVKIVLFLLTNSLHVNNKTLSTDPGPIKYVTFISRKRYLTPEEIYEKNKHLLFIDPEETEKADEVMK